MMAQENSSAGALVVEQLRENGLWVTLGRFCQLPYIEEDEDYTRPTQYAYASALRLVLQAGDLLPGAFPPALLTTTEQGGINWYWRKPDFSVQLTVASAPMGKDYLYVRDRGQSVMDEDVTAQHLADRLREFNAR
jgi:hypothetical protein